MSTQELIEAMENLAPDNVTVKDGICKEIYGENASHEDYTNEEIIAKLKTMDQVLQIQKVIKYDTTFNFISKYQQRRQ